MTKIDLWHKTFVLNSLLSFFSGRFAMAQDGPAPGGAGGGGYPNNMGGGNNTEWLVHPTSMKFVIGRELEAPTFTIDEGPGHVTLRHLTLAEVIARLRNWA